MEGRLINWGLGNFLRFPKGWRQATEVAFLLFLLGISSLFNFPWVH
jgi:hypothetical protein